MARIALDAMGGDDAPAATVAGARRALAAGLDVVLVGDHHEVTALLRDGTGRPPVVHAGDVVGMDEDAAVALRAKPDASVRVAAKLVADGQADALVSAGATGATLVASALTIGRIAGVRRPGVAATLPLAGGTTAVLIDAGASLDAQPEQLVGYAGLGVAYARLLGSDRPRVGLLNVGVEPGKGNTLARATFELLGSMEGFVGNVEPAGVLAGAADVVVTDGFTGNLFLKALEAIAGPQGDDAVGAALVLGVRSPVLVAHGRADAHEIAAALATADRLVRGDLVARMADVIGPKTAGPR